MTLWKRIRRIIRNICILLVVLVTGIALICHHEIKISKERIDITSYTLDADFTQDVTLVMISDVHDYHCTNKNEIVAHIKSMAPDLIICNGDIIDATSPDDQEVINFLVQLKAIAPVYMTLGNHEETYYQAHPDDIAHIEENGITLLEEEYEDLTIKGQSFRLGGMYNYAFSTMTGHISEDDIAKDTSLQFVKDFCATEKYKIMIAHRPECFIYCDARLWDIDAVLCGHTHGGQVIIGYQGLFAPEQGLLPKYDYGLYYLANQTMIITRGISSSSHRIPRFHNPAEIVKITLS